MEAEQKWTTDALCTYIKDKVNGLRENMMKSEALFNKQFEMLENKIKSDIISQGRSIEIALAASDRAVTKAEIATEKRFESVNEFRSQLADQARSFVPRVEYMSQHAALADRITQFGELFTIKNDDITSKLNEITLKIVPREEIEARRTNVNEKLNSIEEKLNSSIGRLDVNQGRLIGGASLRDSLVAVSIFISIGLTVILHLIH